MDRRGLADELEFNRGALRQPYVQHGPSKGHVRHELDLVGDEPAPSRVADVFGGSLMTALPVDSRRSPTSRVNAPNR